MKYLILLIASIAGWMPEATNDNAKAWKVNKESAISIQGSSNVNDFAFDLKQYTGCDTLIASVKGSTVLFQKGMLRLPVNDFKNPNPMLVRDFKKTINAKAYPQIVMNFRSLSAIPAAGAQKLPVSAVVDICLAGQVKTFRINLWATHTNGIVQLQGRERMRFSDFGLTAPNKVLGFISVKDELNVVFNLALKNC